MTLLPSIRIGPDFYKKSVEELEEFMEESERRIEASESETSKEDKRQRRDNFINASLVYLYD